jgi:hypothetical protein
VTRHTARRASCRLKEKKTFTAKTQRKTLNYCHRFSQIDTDEKTEARDKKKNGLTQSHEERKGKFTTRNSAVNLIFSGFCQWMYIG